MEFNNSADNQTSTGTQEQLQSTQTTVYLTSSAPQVTSTARVGSATHRLYTELDCVSPYIGFPGPFDFSHADIFDNGQITRLDVGVEQNLLSGYECNIVVAWIVAMAPGQNIR